MQKVLSRKIQKNWRILLSKRGESLIDRNKTRFRHKTTQFAVLMHSHYLPQSKKLLRDFLTAYAQVQVFKIKVTQITEVIKTVQRNFLNRVKENIPRRKKILDELIKRKIQSTLMNLSKKTQKKQREKLQAISHEIVLAKKEVIMRYLRFC